MTEAVATRAGRWDLANEPSTSGELFNQIHERISFLRHLHYDQYVPTMGPDQVTDFEARLERWLDNLHDEADQRLLLELVPQIIFFGRDEFTKLYQSALRGPVTRWIVEQCHLDFSTPDLDARLRAELYEHTWFCACSDSMQISDFYHANRLGGINHRPDLRTLAKFGDVRRIIDFMRCGHRVKLKRMVVLEDFIGSGAQLIEDAKDLILRLLNEPIPILLAPLIICPEGSRAIAREFGGSADFRLDPVLRLDEELFINAKAHPSANTLDAKIKELAHRSYPNVKGDDAAKPLPYTPFGFLDTGALVVLYSNTPANTLPIIQHQSNTWSSLFPRSARVK